MSVLREGRWVDNRQELLHGQDGLDDRRHGRGRCAASQHGLSSKTMNLITSECGATRFLIIKWP